ncbi:SDR family oxidoreductase [Cytophagaceae bacterium YF14B1]|uniref:SDR family oxidoreductase n=1 Tax=Xanthocytophaga flava TaxID=3048013 RepID=A0AAE3UB82_9BACT|nr:SDR family oxidoreductase [Xanthocytophaga flavus]MDJ1486241.1 SDR family oxidoreductase [Xanthocytophaga flavus]
MDLQLKSKTAFISGSTQGIGFAIAKQMLQEGANVIINGRTEERVNYAVAQLKKEIPDAVVKGIAADFSTVSEVEKLIAELPSVDILINNVGIFELKPFEEISDADWLKFMEINIMSGVRLSRALFPKMIEKNWGRIIFIGSESAINVPANMIHYGMTKTAMLAISNGLAKRTKGTAVTVNTLLGGPVYSEGVADTVTEIAATLNIEVEQMKTNIITNTNPTSLLQRFIDPSEIATLAVFLASPLSTAINGASLRADGGVLTTLT